MSVKKSCQVCKKILHLSNRVISSFSPYLAVEKAIRTVSNPTWIELHILMFSFSLFVGFLYTQPCQCTSLSLLLYSSTSESTWLPSVNIAHIFYLMLLFFGFYCYCLAILPLSYDCPTYLFLLFSVDTFSCVIEPFRCFHELQTVPWRPNSPDAPN